MEQVKQNVASACQSGPDTLTDEERALIARVRDKYRELMPIPCTDCKYCIPCPNGVSIPRIFRIYNEVIIYNTPDKGRMFYSWIKEEERADQCVQCGECEEKCPQDIEIIQWLEKAHQVLGEGAEP
jgi:predicted aldo/keto reductase-like oxidoreductase